MGTLPESVVNHCFVLVDGDGTGGVYYYSRGSRRGRGDAVNRAKDELFLEMREEGKVTSSLMTTIEEWLLTKTR